MPYSWCGKRLGWERPLWPSGSAAATQKPLRAAMDMGIAHNFFSTMSQEFWRRYMMFTTMGHTVCHPRHYWRPAQQFREAIGAK